MKTPALGLNPTFKNIPSQSCLLKGVLGLTLNPSSLLEGGLGGGVQLYYTGISFTFKIDGKLANWI